MSEEIEIKIIESSYGFEAGQIYKAKLHEEGYFANNQSISKLIPKNQAVLCESTKQ